MHGRRMLRGVAASLALATLVACSGGTGNAPASNGQFLFGVLSGLVGGRGETVPDAREVLTPALLARSPTPVLLLVVQARDSGLTMVPAANNLGTEQWRDAVGGAVFRRDGILVGTRGFGFDLHTADVAPLAAALRRGGGEDVVRVNRYIDGENQIVARQFICSVRATGRERLVRYGTAFDTVAYDESCIGDGPPFVNRYWVDGSGTVRRSIELITPESGSLLIDLLKS